MNTSRSSAATAAEPNRAGTAGTPTPGYGIAAPAYRLPAETRLGRVRLQVADLARSVAYYEQVIGLREIGRGEASVILAPAGDDNALVELHERAGASPVPRRGRLGL